MGKMVEGFFCRNKKGRSRLNLSKKYKWYLPKALVSDVEKDDIVGLNFNDRVVPFLVVDVLEWDRNIYHKVEKVIRKNSGLLKEFGLEENSVDKKYKRLSEQDKEDIRTMKANGKKLREIAEIYNYSISSIHRIINEK